MGFPPCSTNCIPQWTSEITPSLGNEAQLLPVCGLLPARGAFLPPPPPRAALRTAPGKGCRDGHHSSGLAGDGPKPKSQPCAESDAELGLVSSHDTAWRTEVSPTQVLGHANCSAKTPATHRAVTKIRASEEPQTQLGES